MRLVIITLIAGWFFGLFFYIYCDFCSLFEVDDSGSSYFIKKFNLEENEAHISALILMYWAFTTVMTIGLGDYYPAGNFERILGAFFMLSGVAYFTII